MTARTKLLKNPAPFRVKVAPSPARLSEKNDRELRSALGKLATVWAFAESSAIRGYSAGAPLLEKRTVEGGQTRWNVGLSLVSQGRGLLFAEPIMPGGKFLGAFDASLEEAVRQLAFFLEAQTPILRPEDPGQFERWASVHRTCTALVQQVMAMLYQPAATAPTPAPTVASTAADREPKKPMDPRNRGRR